MIVGILGSSGCGGTFLNWSLHYLRGDTHAWVVPYEQTDRSIINNCKIVEIGDNPLKGTTAHNYQKTHPNNGSLNQVIDIFKSLPADKLYTFYYVDSMLPTQVSTTHNNIITSYTDVSFITYNYSELDVDTIFCLQFEKIPMIAKALINEAQYQQNKISELPIWDQRELLSLYYPKTIRGQTVNEIIHKHNNSFQLEFDDMLNSLNLVIKDILDFLRIKIDNRRWSTWIEIYNLWKQGNNIKFYQDLDKIINCILINADYDLAPYNMTFAKEVVIASRLLHDHNKSLKAYNIDKVPTNTQSWYAILEENVYHKL